MTDSYDDSQIKIAKTYGRETPRIEDKIENKILQFIEVRLKYYGTFYIRPWRSVQIPSFNVKQDLFRLASGRGRGG